MSGAERLAGLRHVLRNQLKCQQAALRLPNTPETRPQVTPARVPFTPNLRGIHEGDHAKIRRPPNRPRRRNRRPDEVAAEHITLIPKRRANPRTSPRMPDILCKRPRRDPERIRALKDKTPTRGRKLRRANLPPIVVTVSHGADVRVETVRFGPEHAGRINAGGGWYQYENQMGPYGSLPPPYPRRAPPTQNIA